MAGLLRRLREMLVSYPADYRRIASVLAGSQPAEDLLRLLERNPHDERRFDFRCCLLQELILRGNPLAGLPGVERFADWMRTRNHPLAWLPLALQSIEATVSDYLPHYSAGGSSCALPYGPSSEVEKSLPIGGEPIAACAEPCPSDLIGAVVQNWQAQSNGMFEVRVFRAERPLCETDLSVAFLRSLNLDSLAGAKEDGIRAERISPDEVFNVLFAAASTGGAYNSGLYGAYGRLEAWRSMAGLTGAVPEAGVEAIAAVAENCIWASFDASSDWFCQVAWDIGLLAVRPDRTSLAVLAATDTD